jgi:ADP-heptose:LPS heptosyltransferase
MSFHQKIAFLYIRLITTTRSTVIYSTLKLLFIKTKTVNKILINRDGAFGDSIVALPALSIIRQNYPDAQIDLLSVNNSGVSFKDIGLEKNLISNLYNISKKERKDVLNTLKKQNYDLFIQIPQNIGIYKSIRNMLLVRFYLKIKSAFGWDTGRIKSFMRFQKQEGLIATETNRFINVLKHNGLSGDIVYPIISQPINDLKISELIKTKPTIAFLIGGKIQAKKWPLNHWVSLAKLIGEKKNILIIGGNTEIDEGKYIIERTTNAINLCGKLKISELLYVLGKIESAISLDTGAMHLCDTTKTKLIALFSTRDLSNKWFPNSKNAVVIEKVLPCSFCLKTVCHDNICMKTILPNEVYSELLKL